MKHLLTRSKSVSLKENGCYLVEAELKMDMKVSQFTCIEQ